MKKVSTLGTFIFTVLVLCACGQKGPLSVEQPSLETPSSQNGEPTQPK